MFLENIKYHAPFFPYKKRSYIIVFFLCIDRKRYKKVKSKRTINLTVCNAVDSFLWRHNYRYFINLKLLNYDSMHCIRFAIFARTKARYFLKFFLFSIIFLLSLRQARRVFLIFYIRDVSRNREISPNVITIYMLSKTNRGKL